MSAVGAIVGCLIAPFIGAWLGRRVAYFSLCALSLLACQVLFRGFHQYNTAFLLMVGVVGGVTAAFYGWLPLYLPELFPTRVRATAQGIAYNFGRIMAAGGAMWGGTLGGNYARMGAIVSMVYIIGMLLIWFAPETRGRPLPETVDDVWRGRKREPDQGFEPATPTPVGAEQRV
jgi:MFS family permease